MDLIAGAQSEVSIRDQKLVSALYCADEHIKSESSGKVTECNSVKNTSACNAYLGKVYPALGKRLDIDSLGVSKNLCYLVGSVIVGIHHHADAKLLTHKDKLLIKFGISDTGNTMARFHLLCYKA